MEGYNVSVGSKEPLMQHFVDPRVAIACLLRSPGIWRKSLILQFHRGYFVRSYTNEELRNNRDARTESDMLKIFAKFVCHTNMR